MVARLARAAQAGRRSGTSFPKKENTFLDGPLSASRWSEYLGANERRLLLPGRQLGGVPSGGHGQPDWEWGWNLHALLAKSLMRPWTAILIIGFGVRAVFKTCSAFLSPRARAGSFREPNNRTGSRGARGWRHSGAEDAAPAASSARVRSEAAARPFRGLLAVSAN